ncbi:putative DNA polymerase [Yellowstone lake phycodnavirus 2]|uniref:putative DNA polymerase n=1 Tax=Yellowstone lake phycodnavirus 2 TaxID=1586714 RepID=UPI0006EB98DE|nr:putative DNA polymerase [Yellowstone lake phycodnavirus 2]BAT22469.1 putative DNA polymerase [Yellowstone lake phycodnavirus 2]
MTHFQAVAWDGQDQDNDQFTIRIFGRAEDGKSVSLGTKFNPYCFVKTDKDLKSFIKSTFWRNLVSCEVHRGKDLWGFQNGELSRFLKVEFKTHRALRSFAYCVDNNKHSELAGCRMYESNIDPVLRFMHVSGCTSTGWIDPGLCEPDAESTCQVNLWAPNWRFITPLSRDDFAPLRIMSFDIECYSSTGAFPDPKNPHDVIFQIGMTTKEFGREGFLDRKCLCLKETAGPDVESFATEKELIKAFEKYLIKIDPDIITGWNIFGFDLEFLIVRATIHCGLNPVWGRIRGEVAALVEKNLSSSALGNNELKMVPMKGRYVFDLFQDVKREHKLESYSLNNVSKHFLKDQKNDMPVKEIFSRYKEGDAAELGEVAEYCIQDTVLPHKLMEKLCQIQNQVEMAKACWVPLAFLSERGQQIKVFSQMAKKARELNFVIPTFRRPNGPDEGKYEGATVLEAQTGAYYGPITALDFASLYPSIMCAENLCYSTLVMNSRYDNLPGVTYEQFGPHRFAQTSGEKPIVSLLPTILADLKAFRKKAKKLMALAEGTPMEAVYNGQQLAYKISMNSIYGFTGASKGMLPCVAIASTVTMRGRQMIEETKNYVEANFPGAKVRYGDTDSVMVEFDVQGRKGQEAIDYSWQQGEMAAEQCTKLFKAPNDLELEKVYAPYVLYSKKRYAAKMYEKGRDGTVVFKKIDIKGLQVVRRDSCPFVRETLKRLLELILESSDPRPAIELAREAAKTLIQGKVPIEKLLMSKQLASAYKVPMPHVAVRDKIRLRAPGSEPQQGDRVPFVIVKGEGRMYEKAEDPVWVREKNVPLDFQYYFTNQFKKPVQDLLEPLVSADLIFDRKFMAKTESTTEVAARKAFLSMFSKKVL